MDSPAVPRFQAVAAAALFSSAGAAIKYTELNAWQVAGFRSGFAALTILALNPTIWRGLTWLTAAVGLANAATMILFVTANKLTTAAGSIYLQATNPIYIVILSPLLLREPLRARDMIFMVFLGIGLGLFFLGIEPPSKTAPNPLLGNFLAAASGLALAVQLVGLRWLHKFSPGGEQSAMAALGAGNLFAFFFCVPFGLPIVGSSAVDWAIVAYLGVFQIGFAYMLLAKSFHRLRALEASLLLLMEPVLNPIWTWLVKGEKPGFWAIAGGLVILVATVVKTVADSFAKSGEAGA